MRCRSTPHGAARAGTLVLVLLGLLASAAWGYRPFVSTDAAVAERARMEVELGYLTLVRTQGETTFMVPQVVLNYGLTSTLELVGEFKGEEAPGTAPQLVDPALSLKAVLRALVTANNLLATDRPKAVAALEKELRIDPEALKVMTEANVYTMALTDAAAKS